MHPSLLAGFAALVAASYWLLVRRRPRLDAAIDSQAIAALNRAQIALVVAADPELLWEREASGSPAAAPPLPVTARERAAFPRRLARQMAGAAPQRLAAIEAAARWGDRASLPLLLRGLRDVDPAVVREAARAMERFRGRSRCGRSPVDSTSSPQTLQALPRNVARTR